MLASAHTCGKFWRQPTQPHVCVQDITPEFLKIHALYYALDVSQKVAL